MDNVEFYKQTRDLVRFHETLLGFTDSKEIKTFLNQKGIDVPKVSARVKHDLEKRLARAKLAKAPQPPK